MTIMVLGGLFNRCWPNTDNGRNEYNCRLTTKGEWCLFSARTANLQLLWNIPRCLLEQGFPEMIAVQFLLGYQQPEDRLIVVWVAALRVTGFSVHSSLALAVDNGCNPAPCRWRELPQSSSSFCLRFFFYLFILTLGASRMQIMQIRLTKSSWRVERGNVGWR